MGKVVITWCTLCGKRFTQEELGDGVNECPSCGDKGLPCPSEQDFLLSINWHELHLLCVWAENWANDNDLGNVVQAIAKRLERQAPNAVSLTLTGELFNLKNIPGLSVVESNIPNPPLIPVNGPGAVGYGVKP